VNPVAGSDLEKTDNQIFNQVDKPLKQATEQLVASMLTHDERGNPIPEKGYSKLTTRELHLLAENLSVRLSGFAQEGDFPAFLPPVVRAVMEHPCLANSDRYLLQTYATLFSLDWKGEQTVSSHA
jgi:hypothetical protein